MFNISKMLIVLCGRVGEFVRYHLLLLFFDFRFCIHVTCSWCDPTYKVIAVLRHVGNTIYVDSIVTGKDISEEQERECLAQAHS